MRRLTSAAAALALGVTGAFVLAASARSAEPPPPPPIPACDAPDGAASVEREYQTMTMSPFERGVLKIGPVTDLGVFPPSQNANRYATSEMFVKAVRYCEAAITLPDGTVDRTYWIIPLSFNVRSWLTVAVFCSVKHDILQSGCARYRPDGAAPAR